jgi:hypothetical protein
MLALLHHPSIPVPERPASPPAGLGTDQPKTAAPAPAVTAEDPQTFLRVLLRALGAIHT